MNLQENVSLGTNFAELTSDQNVYQKRIQYAADIVIKLVAEISGIDICGAVNTYTLYNQGFHPDSSGLDLSWNTHGHVAVIEGRPSASCKTNNIAHEVGHILGGGHENSPGGAFSYSLGAVSGFAQTIMGHSDSACPSPPCTTYETFSYPGNIQSGQPLGSSTRNNKLSFQQTSASVANYYEPPPVPAAPSVVDTFRLSCVGWNQAAYFLSWLPKPVPNAAHHNVYYPNGASWYFAGQTDADDNPDIYYVYNIETDLYMTSCNAYGDCSWMSADSGHVTSTLCGSEGGGSPPG